MVYAIQGSGEIFMLGIVCDWLQVTNGGLLLNPRSHQIISKFFYKVTLTWKNWTVFELVFLFVLELPMTKVASDYRDPPISVSWVLESKAWAAMPGSTRQIFVEPWVRIFNK